MADATIKAPSHSVFLPIFLDNQIKKGVNIALEKRNNSADDIDATFASIFQKCATYGKKEINSSAVKNPAGFSSYK